MNDVGALPLSPRLPTVVFLPTQTLPAREGPKGRVTSGLLTRTQPWLCRPSARSCRIRGKAFVHCT